MTEAVTAVSAITATSNNNSTVNVPYGASISADVHAFEASLESARARTGLTESVEVSLTVQSQKFMFHSQLTANVANRTADGVQQLFRQQG